MELEFKHLLPQDFSPESRVWVYQCSRQLGMSEALQMEPMIEDFIAQWQAHGASVKAYGNLLFGQFLVLIADEKAGAAVSGCSTDSSVRFVKSLEQRFNVNFFDRTMLAFFRKEKIERLPMGQLQYAWDNGFIDGETPYFNNVVQTKKELETDWIIPVAKSWLFRRLRTGANAAS